MTNKLLCMIKSLTDTCLHLLYYYLYISSGFVRQGGVDKPGCGTLREEACATLDYLLTLESEAEVSTSQGAQSKQIVTDKSISTWQQIMVRVLFS